MKLAMLILVVALILGGLVGVLMARDSGYVLVAYQDIAIETSLWVAALLVVLTFLVAYALIRLAVRIRHGAERLEDWTRRRRGRAAHEQTQRGMQMLAEEQWSQARSLLAASAGRVDEPLMNYLHAARAAHAMGDHDGCDKLLNAALESAPDAELAVGLTRAELQCGAGRWEPCLAALLPLRSRHPKHPGVLRLLVRCYRSLHDWRAVLDLSHDLKRHHVFEEQELHALQIEAWEGRLHEDAEDPEALWDSVPKGLRHEPRLIVQAVRALQAAQRAGTAEKLLRRAVEHEWNGELVRRYGMVQSEEPLRQLDVAESWLKDHDNDPDLLLTLGRLSLMNQQWDKAREYLEASLRLRRSRETQLELGRLCAALGETDRSSELLSQALDELPALPLPPHRGMA